MVAREWVVRIVLASLLALAGCSGAAAPGLQDASGFAPDGSLSADPQMVDFGYVVVNATESKSITLSNQSGADLRLLARLDSATQSFSVDPGPIVVKAGGSQDLLVTFAPKIPSGGAEEVASLSLAPEGGSPVSVALQGIALATALQITPNPLDFNFVQPGQQRTLAVQIENLGSGPIQLASVAVTPSSGVFSLDAGVMASLPSGQSLSLEVTFTPTGTISQSYAGSLQITSDDVLAEQDVSLKGYCGGAAISCTPTSLAFSETAVGLTSTLPVICTNTGTDVPMPGGQIDPAAELQNLTFQLAPEDSGFAVKLDPQWTLSMLSAGQAVQVDVSYSPKAAQNDSASLTVKSNVTTQPAPMITLSGIGVVEPKCAYRVSPNALSWGQVGLGIGLIAQTVTVENLGPNECLLNDVALQPCSAGFSLPNGSILSQRLSPPGAGGAYPTFLNVPVAFSPQESGDFSGTLQLEISDSDAPVVTVPLSATPGDSCFQLMPTQMAFGVIGASGGGYCAVPSQSFVGVNLCDAPVTISGVTLSAASNLANLALPALPLTVDAGESSAAFQLGFTPSAPGTYAGMALVQTDLQPTPLGLSFAGTAASGPSWTDRFTGGASAVDILWVMDTADWAQRETVGNAAEVYLTALTSAGIDFQMGVTSTDVCTTPPAEEGQLVPCPGCHIPGTSPTILTAADPNLASDLATLMYLGGSSQDCAPGKEFFAAGYEAVVQGQGATANGLNGFIRSGALLEIIAVNGDETDDNSREQTPNWYASQYLSVKGADHPELFSWSYINPSGYGAMGGHQPFNRLPERVASLLGFVGGVAVDTTQSDWTQALEDLWGAIPTGTFYRLSGTPDPSSIRVYLDGPPPDQTAAGETAGVTVPASNTDGSVNWTYDAASNGIDLNTPTFSLTLSDVIYVEYNLVCP